jgi:hypothetical protein
VLVAVAVDGGETAGRELGVRVGARATAGVEGAGCAFTAKVALGAGSGVALAMAAGSAVTTGVVTGASALACELALARVMVSVAPPMTATAASAIAAIMTGVARRRGAAGAGASGAANRSGAASGEANANGVPLFFGVVASAFRSMREELSVGVDADAGAGSGVAFFNISRENRTLLSFRSPVARGVGEHTPPLLFRRSGSREYRAPDAEESGFIIGSDAWKHASIGRRFFSKPMTIQGRPTPR